MSLRRALLLSASLGFAMLSVAAWSQSPPAAQGAPKSLLPDDLEAPAAPVGTVQPVQPEGPIALPGFEPVAPVILPAPPPEPEPKKSDPLAELAGPVMQPRNAGILSPDSGGYAADLFAGSDGRFLATILNRIDAPLASRWAQIMVQRALLSTANAPGALHPADWVAARASALSAMGSASDAHRLVSRIAIDQYTPALYAAAAHVALASADPVALCPLSPIARAITESPIWELADAMCLSILGDDINATAIFDRLRRSEKMGPLDVGLAERIGSAAGSGRRGANPEWEEADGPLTAWRLGLAAAGGLEIPEAQWATATPALKGWAVRLANLPTAKRASLAAEAAAIGAISAAEINRLLAADMADMESSKLTESPAGRLRVSWRAADTAERLDAMKALWALAPDGSAAHYGWQVATAPAAARIGPNSALAADAGGIAASLNAAGLAEAALQWWSVAGSGSDGSRAALWAEVVALSDAVPVQGSLFDNWSRNVSPHRARLLAAGLAGLGRGEVGPTIAPLDNEWTRALDRAVAQGRKGEAMVVIASGMRGTWAELHPDYLRRIAAALNRLGLQDEARLIVAEAANRG